jgi:hypothetical protein
VICPVRSSKVVERRENGEEHLSLSARRSSNISQSLSLAIECNQHRARLERERKVWIDRIICVSHAIGTLSGINGFEFKRCCTGHEQVDRRNELTIRSQEMVDGGMKMITCISIAMILSICAFPFVFLPQKNRYG